jgi:hypothetical protein
VGKFVGDDAVVGLAEGGEGKRVGGGPREDEVNVAIGFKEVSKGITGLGREGVFAVGGECAGIGAEDSL